MRESARPYLISSMLCSQRNHNSLSNIKASARSLISHILDGVPGAEESKILVSKFQSKEKADVIINLLEEEPFSRFTDDEKIDLFVQSALKVGSKTFSHLLATTER